jgi:hypothetical protein
MKFQLQDMSHSRKRKLFYFLFTGILAHFVSALTGQVVINTIPAPGKSQDVTWDRHHIWVTDDLSRKYYKMEADDGEIIKSYPFPEGLLYCDGITFDGKFHWICGWEDPSGSGSRIYKIAPDSIGIIMSFDYPGAYDGNWPHGITYGGSVLWANNMRTLTLDKIDTDSGELIGTLPSPSANSVGIAWDGIFLWTNDVELGLIYKQDAITGEILGSIPMPAENCRGMEWDGNYLWTVSWQTGTLYQIDVGELGIPEKPSFEINIYPNPGKGVFYLSFDLPHPGNLNVAVIDALGKEMRKIHYKNLSPGMNHVALGLEGLPEGIYFLRVDNGSDFGYRKVILAR